MPSAEESHAFAGESSWYATGSNPGTKKPELPVKSWILSDTPSHVGEKTTGISGMRSKQGQKAQVNHTSRWRRSHVVHLSLTLHLRPSGGGLGWEIKMPSYDIAKRDWPHRWIQSNVDHFCLMGRTSKGAPGHLLCGERGEVQGQTSKDS